VLTREAAAEARVPPKAVEYLLRHRRLDPPKKDISGRFIWEEPDVLRLREAAARRRRYTRRTEPAVA
jgi:hypothetical protein